MLTGFSSYSTTNDGLAALMAIGVAILIGNAITIGTLARHNRNTSRRFAVLSGALATTAAATGFFGFDWVLHAIALYSIVLSGMFLLAAHRTIGMLRASGLALACIIVMTLLLGVAAFVTYLPR